MVIMKICRKEGTEMSVSYLPYLLDILVVAVVLGCAAAAFRKGFVIAALGFLPMAAALIGARFLSPYVSRFLRGTPVFGSLAESISSSMKLDEIIGEGRGTHADGNHRGDAAAGIFAGCTAGK